MTLPTLTLKKLRERAHVHSDNCYGRYETCGEHHMHDDTCGSRPRICRRHEDTDLLALLTEFDRLLARSYPLTAELHCDAHGYYDGRRPCALCVDEQLATAQHERDEALAEVAELRRLLDAR